MGKIHARTPGGQVVPALPDGRGTPPRGSGFTGLLGRIFAGLVAVAMLVLGFMFSLAIFAVALVAGVALFGWLWWKLRRTMRQIDEDLRFQEFAARAGRRKPPAQADVIEGEVIREEWRDGKGE
jgi:hypothetical protein